VARGCPSCVDLAIAVKHRGQSEGELCTIEAAGRTGAEFVLDTGAGDQRGSQRCPIQLSSKALGAWIEQAKVGVGLGDAIESVVQGNTVGGMGGKCRAQQNDQRGQGREIQTAGGSPQTANVTGPPPTPVPPSGREQGAETPRPGGPGPVPSSRVWLNRP